jgi:anaerobic ribonucleoside-triphosphate reductase activating protein
MHIYVAGIVYGSMLDGDGLRTVVFFSGCSVGCYACQNKQYWNKLDGKSIKITDLENLIRQNTPQKKITISGGEPMEQKFALKQLLNCLVDFDIGLYTSFDMTDIDADIVNQLRFIKVGKFEKDKLVYNQYFGSENQKIYYVKEKNGNM